MSRKRSGLKILRKKRHKVVEKNIAEVISMVTGIPLERVEQNESNRLLGMPKKIS